ncbi:MAG: Hg(II)-responsive transcriptional regulator [Betaproteobacteria bacterium]|nr:Hg(II)-responsive transcriptional regulator [Betaproteobacteria bacterium]
MKKPSEGITIGALAGAARVNVETIRFYERKGLMHKPPRPLGGIRRYGEPALARLRFIKAAQRLGFGLSEIADLLALADGTHCREARAQAERKLHEVRSKLADLRSIELTLQGFVDRCDSSRGQAPCPLIAALQAP